MENQKRVARIAISEELIQDGQLDKFIKYPGVTITLLSTKPSTIENLDSATKSYKRFKSIHAIRLADKIPNLSQIDILFLKKDKFDYARELAKSAENMAWKRRIFVYLQFGSDDTMIVEDLFCYCGWQYFSEYVREYLKVPNKEKKPTKAHKRDEPDYKIEQAEPVQDDVIPLDEEIPPSDFNNENYVSPEDSPF